VDLGSYGEWSDVSPSVLFLFFFYQNQPIYSFHATEKKLFEDGIFSGEILICNFPF
jgi:hypothetical protein